MALKIHDIVGSIYLVTNIVNNKKYIGSTIKPPSHRWSQHKSAARNGCKYRFYEAIRKYGEKNFEFEVLFCTKNINILEEIEQEFIDKFNTIDFNFGYNSIPVGNNRIYIQKCMKNEWIKNREPRIKAMKAASAYRAKPVIGINRFDLSILEFSTISDYIKAGYHWSVLRACLRNEAKHGHDYCWFYKTHNNIEQYKEEALKRLKHMYKPDDIRPIKAVNSNEEIIFNTLNEVIDRGFNKKEVRRNLQGKTKSHLGFKFSYIF